LIVVFSSNESSFVTRINSCCVNKPSGGVLRRGVFLCLGC